MRSFLKKLLRLDIDEQNMELASGIFAVVIAILAFLTTFGTKSFSSSDIQPQTIPQILCVAMAVLGMILIVRWCIKKKKGLIKSAKKTDAEKMDRMEVFRRITPTVCFVLLAGYVWLMRPLGFVCASVLYLTVQIPFLSVDLSPKSFLKAFAIGVVTAVAAYLIFVTGFGLQLPTNRFGF